MALRHTEAPEAEAVQGNPQVAVPHFEGAILDELEFESLFRLTALAEASRHKSATRKERLGDSGPKENSTHEEIELRAYHIFLDRGGAHGHDLEDWMRAQRELLEKAWRERRREESKRVVSGGAAGLGL